MRPSMDDVKRSVVGCSTDTGLVIKETPLTACRWSVLSRIGRRSATFKPIPYYSHPVELKSPCTYRTIPENAPMAVLAGHVRVSSYRLIIFIYEYKYREFAESCRARKGKEALHTSRFWK
jgi:hypothetical protein